MQAQAEVRAPVTALAMVLASGRADAGYADCRQRRPGRHRNSWVWSPSHRRGWQLPAPLELPEPLELPQEGPQVPVAVQAPVRVQARVLVPGAGAALQTVPGLPDPPTGEPPSRSAATGTTSRSAEVALWGAAQ